MTLKRFWKNVGVEQRSGRDHIFKNYACSFSYFKDGFAILLDSRALKTPSGNTLVIPREKRLAAALIANEWNNQEKVLKPHALPIVRYMVLST